MRIFRIRTRRNGRNVFAVILVLSLIFTSMTLFSVENRQLHAASSIADLNGKQEEIAQKLEQIKKEKEELKNKTKDLQGELSWLNSKTEAERQKYSELVEELNSAYSEMDAALTEASESEKALEEKKEQYRDRLQAMFENRNKSTLEMLFEAEDMSEFFANIQLISIIAENDRNTIDELDSAKAEAFLKREKAETYCEEMQEYVDEKKNEIEALKKSISSAANELDTRKQELSVAEKEEKALLAESEKIKDEIKKLQTAAAYYGGTMVWPTPGYTGINPTNYFGMRLHPVYKYWRMHNGIDINAPFNSKIVSAAEGKVILVRTISGYNSSTGNNYGGSGYGNYIIVDHGGGISTLYAHCKLLKVKTGDVVKAGQWIAVTGSTGTSTGAHLHFEVRENGSPVDPLQKKYLGVRK